MFQAEALEADDKLNCVTKFFPESESWAKALEAIPIEKRHTLPLFGIPISVKECYAVKGHPSTLGLLKYADEVEVKDSEVVRCFKCLGAVPFCHTNLSHAMAALECSNPLYGKTSHPLDSKRDVGGSLRNPAAMCGLCALRPSYGRHLSQIGVRFADSDVSLGASAVGGFLANDSETLLTACKAVWSK